MRKVLAVIVILMLLSGCLEDTQTRTEEAEAAVGVYDVEHYVERENIRRRLEMFDNQAQVSWIYCLAENGQVIFYGDVLGKVTSSGKRLEPKLSRPESCASQFNGVCVNEFMGADMTYGSSDSYVYWFDGNGNYYQWGGLYFLSSHAIKINESVLNVRDVE